MSQCSVETPKRPRASYNSHNCLHVIMCLCHLPVCYFEANMLIQ